MYNFDARRGTVARATFGRSAWSFTLWPSASCRASTRRARRAAAPRGTSRRSWRATDRGTARRRWRPYFVPRIVSKPRQSRVRVEIEERGPAVVLLLILREGRRTSLPRLSSPTPPPLLARALLVRHPSCAPSSNKRGASSRASARRRQSLSRGCARSAAPSRQRAPCSLACSGGVRPIPTPPGAVRTPRGAPIIA